MYKTKLCISAGACAIEDIREQLVMVKNVGFEAFFTGCRELEDLKATRKAADELGLYYQSIHAPFGGEASAREMWKEGENGERAFEIMKGWIEATSEVAVDMLICHCFIGFNTGESPTELGLERYGKLIDRAEELGVRLAFENVEGDEFLAAVINTYRGRKGVGFCWDSGHEMCYNRSVDQLALYGDILLGTHLHDNLGIQSYDGVVTSRDDLHLLPYDGVADWDELALRLAKTGFDGPLTFELGTQHTPHYRGRFEKKKYETHTVETWMSEIYIRACRFATAFQKAQKKLQVK